MDRKLLLVGLSAAVLLAGMALGTVLFSRASELRGAAYAEPYPVAADFELTRSDGTLFRLSEMQGRVVLLFFGYTACPDVCPTALAELKLVLEEFGHDQAEDVQVVFVTVDPARDDPTRVQEYVNHFNAGFIGLSGAEPNLVKIWNEYGIFRETVNDASAAGYQINHTARVTLIDRRGRLRVSFGFDATVDDIVHDVKLILKQD